MDDSPWLVGGDLNAILWHNGTSAPSCNNGNLISDFRSALDACSLFDIGFFRNQFTWCNYRFANAQVCKCLDRFLCNSSFFSTFSMAAIAGSYNNPPSLDFHTIHLLEDELTGLLEQEEIYWNKDPGKIG